MAEKYDEASIRASMGAVLLGGLFSVFLSGIVAMQVYLYCRVYVKDRLRIKLMVALIWTMDFTHTIMVCVANWMYLIEGFGNTAGIDHITWSVGATVALTALVTFFVHCFFTHRIYIVSKGNKLMTLPLAFLAFFRLAAALVSTVEMIQLASFHAFVRHYEWVFTMGLSTAVALDVFITFGLCHYLRKSKSGFKSMNDIIDSLILYTVETGLITSVTTIISLVCWVTMPNNLIFLGLHFTISKLYTNSLLATLNSRATLRARSTSTSQSSRDLSLPMMLSGSRRPPSGLVPGGTRPSADFIRPKGLEITVSRTVQRDIDGEITEVNLKSYGEALHIEDSDGGSSNRSSASGDGLQRENNHSGVSSSRRYSDDVIAIA